MESQVIRTFGGTDGLGMFLLVAGGILAVAGVASAFSVPVPRTEATASAVTTNCPSCGRLVFPNMTKCGCGQILITANDFLHAKEEIGKPIVPAGDTIEQLERLTALKERGALSDHEFQQQKSKLLG
jgi:hypothetical protein